MNAKTTRILKEARPLFWPWCLVTLVGALPFVHPADWNEGVTLMGFFLGIPLLAALPLGNEFQHRTLSLLLTEPVERMEVWAEKFSVTVVAVLSAALVFLLGWRAGAVQLDPVFPPPLLVGPWVIAIIASATFWTLFTRSTIGGVALNGGINFFILHFSLRYLVYRFHGIGGLSPANPSVLAATSVCLCYAGVMLWLGRRTLARFQATGGMAGDDLLMAGPSVMPGALAGWFRCRPTGAVLNMIRKELRLLRPLWLITLLAVAGWSCLTLLELAPQPGSVKNFSSAVLPVVAMGVISTLMLAILAGSLSVGEERTSGTLAWHITLPVSARRQWLVKLLMALCASVVCAVLLPMLVLVAGGFQFGTPFIWAHTSDAYTRVPLNGATIWMLCVLLLSFASFWCACAVNGTVRAVLWVLPMILALPFAAACGGSAAGQLMPHLISRFEFFSDFRFINPVSKLPFGYFPGLRYINPVSKSLPTYIVGSMTIYFLIEVLSFGTILAIAVVQSYRLFRAQAQDSLSPLIRNLLPLATIAFMFSFSQVAYHSLVGAAWVGWDSLFRETSTAIQKIQADTAKLDATHPLQLTAEELAQASHLSEPTRRWLRNARIIVALPPGKAKFTIPIPADSGRTKRYLVTIHLASGSDCTFTSIMGEHYYYSRGLRRMAGPYYFYYGAVCK